MIPYALHIIAAQALPFYCSLDNNVTHLVDQSLPGVPGYPRSPLSPLLPSGPGNPRKPTENIISDQLIAFELCVPAKPDSLKLISSLQCAMHAEKNYNIWILIVKTASYWFKIYFGKRFAYISNQNLIALHLQWDNFPKTVFLYFFF